MLGVGDALGKVLDPALKRRGFADRDLIANWSAIAPAPYDKVAMPDGLNWPRGDAAAGATLFLRCAPAHALALAHEGPAIAAAVNRYFGYVLVGRVKISSAPFSPRSGASAHQEAEPDPRATEQVGKAIADIKDEGLRQALRKLGLGVMNKRRR